MNKRLVSVIITTKNEERSIEKLLKSIKSQSWKSFETVVVDNNSTDNTVKISKEYTNNTFNFGPERSAQRNLGAKKSKGEFLLFLDADMILTKNVLKECVEKFLNEKHLGGVIIPEKSIGNSFWAKVKAYERHFYENGSTVEAARFFSKKVFEKIGGYDEQITGPEDWDFSERVQKAYKVLRIKSHIVHDEQNLSLINLLSKKYYYAKKAKVYLKKNKLPTVSAKTIPVFRSEFYKNPKEIFLHPVLFCAMICMLILETIVAGFGYLNSR